MSEKGHLISGSVFFEDAYIRDSCWKNLWTYCVHVSLENTIFWLHINQKIYIYQVFWSHLTSIFVQLPLHVQTQWTECLQLLVSATNTVCICMRTIQLHCEVVSTLNTWPLASLQKFEFLWHLQENFCHYQNWCLCSNSVSLQLDTEDGEIPHVKQD